MSPSVSLSLTFPMHLSKCSKEIVIICSTSIVLLNGVLPVIWDYSNVFLNYKGIICLPFSLIWVVLSIIAVIIADAINYYLLDDEEVIHTTNFSERQF